MLQGLARLDGELAARAKARDCAHCGGPLHVADYARKPRGGPWPVPEEMAIRRALCCGRQGCRRRTRVPSALFLGRRVYLGAIVVLAAVLQHGVNAKRVGLLSRELDVDRRTLTRWRRWWLETFPRTRTYAAIRSVIVPPPELATMPLSLVSSYEGIDPPARITALLRHLARVEEAA